MKFRAGFSVKLCFSILSESMNLEIFWSSFISVRLQFQLIYLITIMCNPVLKDKAPSGNGLMLIIIFFLKLKDGHSFQFFIYLICIDLEATCS